jgi:hypothetical protein
MVIAIVHKEIAVVALHPDAMAPAAVRDVTQVTPVHHAATDLQVRVAHAATALQVKADLVVTALQVRVAHAATALQVRVVVRAVTEVALAVLEIVMEPALRENGSKSLVTSR